MELFISFILLGLSLGLLVYGANKFVDSATLIAEKIGINEFIIGVTIVALGTSVPEFFVGISSVINDNEEIALGAVIGSNISNIALIFGISCIGYSAMQPAYNRNIIAVIASTAVALYALSDLTIDSFDSILFLLVLFYFIYALINRPGVYKGSGTDNNSKLINAFLMLAFGFILLLIGSNYAVIYGEKTALILGIPELIIGLTVLAIGTSLPELAVTINALLKKKNSMVLGNIVGSNILNLVIVLPILGLFSNQTYSNLIISRDLLMMSIFTFIFILIALSFNLKNIPAYAYRITGALLVSGYIYYIGNLANFF